MGFYEQIPELPKDPIFGLSADFKKDPRTNKQTLITGYFRDEQLKTPVLETVAEVETELAEKRLVREYLPIDGDQEFTAEIGELVFGPGYDRERIYAAQTVGGTGALYCIGAFARNWTNLIAISDPTWANHWTIFSAAGLKTEPYPYYENKAIPFDSLLQKLSSLPSKSCVLLHTNCHNSTGLDFSKKQWKVLAELIQHKQLYPILDMAYQGFSDTPEEDAFAPRLFLKKGIEFALTYTCAKNFSLYSERVGALFIIASSAKQVPAIGSQICKLIRGCYSNPPFHGVAIVKKILKSNELHARWLQEIEQMRIRMKKIRAAFVDAMKEKDPEGGWEALRNGRGLFCMAGLSEEAVSWLREEKGIYLSGGGRINLTGLNDENLSRFIEALSEAGKK